MRLKVKLFSETVVLLSAKYTASCMRWIFFFFCGIKKLATHNYFKSIISKTNTKINSVPEVNIM